MHKVRNFFMNMSLKELEEIAYSVQIDYEAPLAEEDRESVVEELIWLIKNMDTIDMESIVKNRKVERESKGIICNTESSVGVDLSSYSDQQLIFYPLDANMYKCYTRFDVSEMLKSGEDIYDGHLLRSREVILLAQLLDEYDYPNIVVYDAPREIEERLGLFSKNREFVYDNNGNIEKITKYRGDKVEYVTFYQEGEPVSTFYV